MRRAAFVVVKCSAAAAAMVLFGCGGATAGSGEPVTLPAPSQAAPPASATASAPPQDVCTSGPPASTKPCSSTAPPLASGAPKLCGCGLCEPILSDDACKVDGDCLPATPCHATACVAAAHAQPRGPGLVCTQEMRCDAIDANRCACVRGHCAIAPKAAR